MINLEKSLRCQLSDCFFHSLSAVNHWKQWENHSGVRSVTHYWNINFTKESQSPKMWVDLTRKEIKRICKRNNVL